jgi:hypothetical protein
MKKAKSSLSVLRYAPPLYLTAQRSNAAGGSVTATARHGSL